MKYILVIFLIGQPPAQIGPFGNVFACEQAAAQVKQAHGGIPVSQRPRTVCINLAAKPHHWNGKVVPK